jgi:hypothetical protein
MIYGSISSLIHWDRQEDWLFEADGMLNTSELRG